MWTQKKPLLKNLKVFGCHAYVHVPSEKRSKLDARSVLCRFLGYSDHEKAYRFEELSSGRIVVSRDAQFMEDTFDSGKRGYAGSKPVEFRDADEATDSEDDDRDGNYSDQDMGEQPQSLHRRTSGRPNQHRRTRADRAKTDERAAAMAAATTSKSAATATAAAEAAECRVPTGSKRHSRTHSLEGLSEPPVEKRYGRVGRTSGASSTPAPGPRSSLDDMSALLASIEEEEEEEDVLTSCIQWEICRRRSSRRWNPATRASGRKRATPSSSREQERDVGARALPRGRKAISSKWVFKVKETAEGLIERYKARLVAKGFLQKYGVDFEETFAPVAKFTSIRIILSIAAQYKLVLHQMDVKTAFLNGLLEEEIYMKQPEGFVDPKYPTMCASSSARCTASSSRLACGTRPSTTSCARSASPSARWTTACTSSVTARP